MALIRADLLLIRQRIADSRSQAADLIRRGQVTANGKPVLKPGTLVDVNAHVALHQLPRYVSRGGLKLEPVLDQIQCDVKGKIALDCGASTGGFTDCLLQYGAKKVFAVDVGYGQLHWKLREDPRVIVMERINLRYLEPEQIENPVDIITMDLSFISLKLVIPAVVRLLTAPGWILAMVKPQFEAGKSKVGSGGVVRDPKIIEAVLTDMGMYFGSLDFRVQNIIPAGVSGPKGNREYFFCMTQGKPLDKMELNTMIGELSMNPGDHE